MQVFSCAKMLSATAWAWAAGDGPELEPALLALRSPREAERVRAAAELRVAVEAAARELSPETFSRFEAELCVGRAASPRRAAPKPRERGSEGGSLGRARARRAAPRRATGGRRAAIRA